MPEMTETKKYTFTVEGETEKWYLDWLEEQIKDSPNRTCIVSINAKVQTSPKKFYKSINKQSIPEVFHVCDVESNEQYHVEHFKNILSEMKEAKQQKGIKYTLGYSNYTFELWMILHKNTCNGSQVHRDKYLKPICDAFGETFEDLGHYKAEDAFKRCLSKLSINDVKTAITRAEKITKHNSEPGNNKLISFKNYKYYENNPALSIHEIIKRILSECGLLE